MAGEGWSALTLCAGLGKGAIMSKKQSRDDQTELMAEDELSRLRNENAELREELAALRFEFDVETCHVAGLTAQIKALIAESEACPHKPAHPLVDRVQYAHARTGEPLLKTRAFPLYREAFDAAAQELGIEEPEQIRA